MTFGEKLFKLRKEKDFSQEALAEKLNTTRQAISKWENGQGYPETEKLLMIGNIFEVSMDYLLKDTVDVSKESEDSYYVSKEMAEGYLLLTRKIAKIVPLGLFFIAISFIPYFIFKDESAIFIFPTIILAVIGIGLFVSAGFLEENQYKILKQEPLIFDEKYLKELIVRYDGLKKKYAFVMVPGMCLFVAGLLAILLEEREYFTSGFIDQYYPLCIVIIAVGIYLLIRASIILDSYKLLSNNDSYTSSIGFKLRSKVRKKVEEF